MIESILFLKHPHLCKSTSQFSYYASLSKEKLYFSLNFSGRQPEIKQCLNAKIWPLMDNEYFVVPASFGIVPGGEKIGCKKQMQYSGATWNLFTCCIRRRINCAHIQASFYPQSMLFFIPTDAIPPIKARSVFCGCCLGSWPWVHSRGLADMSFLCVGEWGKLGSGSRSPQVSWA